MLVAIATLALFTSLTLARGFDAIAAPGLDLVVDTATSVTLLAVAMLVWARFRARGDAMSLSQGIAFSILTLTSVATIVPRLTGAIPVAERDIPSTHATFYLNAFARGSPPARSRRRPRGDAAGEADDVAPPSSHPSRSRSC